MLRFSLTIIDGEKTQSIDNATLCNLKIFSNDKFLFY